MSQIGLAEREVLHAIEPEAARLAAAWLRPIDHIWQPSDLLPRATDTAALEELRSRAAELPDALMVVLIGDTITEEALPSYTAWLNRIGPISDATGTDQGPWGRWIRGWTAEEARHGTVLDRYLYLTGRVNMVAVERTKQHLIANGFNPRIESAYEAFAYTAFQEEATRLSHLNVARQAREYGDEILHRICGSISGDERRHGQFYAGVMRAIFEHDPDGATVAVSHMFDAKGVVMPAALMQDRSHQLLGRTSSLFDRFADVAQAAGVYTARHYVEIARQLIDGWRVEHLAPLSDQAKRAQEQLSKFVDDYAARLERIMNQRLARKPAPAFSWIFDRTVLLPSLG